MWQKDTLRLQGLGTTATFVPPITTPMSMIIRAVEGFLHAFARQSVFFQRVFPSLNVMACCPIKSAMRTKVDYTYANTVN